MTVQKQLEFFLLSSLLNPLEDVLPRGSVGVLIMRHLGSSHELVTG